MTDAAVTWHAATGSWCETMLKRGRSKVLTLSENDLMRMKAALLEDDRDEAMLILRELVKHLQIQAGKGLKSHLDGN